MLGLFNKSLWRISVAYAALQAVIWVKCVWFFFAYGFGRAALFNAAFFPPEAKLFNFWFHEAMHLAIALLAVLFGVKLNLVEARKLLTLVFAAVALHNLAYWFTKSYPSTLHILLDFAADSAILFAFIVTASAAQKFLLQKRKQLAPTPNE